MQDIFVAISKRMQNLIHSFDRRTAGILASVKAAGSCLEAASSDLAAQIAQTALGKGRMPSPSSELVQ